MLGNDETETHNSKLITETTPGLEITRSFESLAASKSQFTGCWRQSREIQGFGVLYEQL